MTTETEVPMLNPTEISCWMKRDGTWWTTGYDGANKVGIYEMPFEAVKSRWKVVTGQVKPG